MLCYICSYKEWVNTYTCLYKYTYKYIQMHRHLLTNVFFSWCGEFTLAVACGRSNGIRCLTLGGNCVRTSFFSLLIIISLKSWCSSFKFEAPLQSHCFLLPKNLKRKKKVNFFWWILAIPNPTETFSA